MEVTIKRIHAGFYYVGGPGFGYYIKRSKGMWALCLPEGMRGEVKVYPQDPKFRTLAQAKQAARRVCDEIWRA